MTEILRRAAPSQSRPQASLRGVDPASALMRGGFALVLLAAVASAAAQLPLRGDVLGLLTGVAGSLAITGILETPERRPLLALFWSALAFALPVILTLAEPGLALGLSLILGSTGLWVIATLASYRHLPEP